MFSLTQAVFYLGIPPAEAIVMGTSLALFVIYKYASSICIIKQNPVTSTYAAVFPYKCVISLEVVFWAAALVGDSSLSNRENFYLTKYLSPRPSASNLRP